MLKWTLDVMGQTSGRARQIQLVRPVPETRNSSTRDSTSYPSDV